MAALAGTALPSLASPAAPHAAGSAWGKKTDIAVPPLAGGTNTAPASKRATPQDAARKAWHTRQRARPSSPATSTQAKARAQLSAGTPPQGQGDVPWHQFHDLRLSKSVAVKVDYSTGNLLVAATDFDIAGVAGNLTWTRTYNSLDAPWGAVSNAWWLGYERYLDTDPATSVDLYDQSGARVSFTKNADGSFTTPAGYSLDLKKNSDNTYTLTDRTSGSKDTYDQYGSLTRIAAATATTRAWNATATPTTPSPDSRSPTTPPAAPSPWSARTPRTGTPTTAAAARSSTTWTAAAGSTRPRTPRATSPSATMTRTAA
ncbi:DUF6531 domain-containing protein [Streptomyces sp. NPDC006632]|uniref:DUF6531 domain-containing protein n=1 Tax=Streptomyces sp. NPDC006632 TaxID=3157182 RepID=UPI0033B926D1